MSQPRPIAFAITELDVGGAEKQFVELVSRLDRRRWSPEVVVLQGEAPFVQSLRAAGVAVTCLNITHWSQLPVAAWRWYRLLRRQKPTVLCTFLYHANVLGRILGRIAGVPLIVNSIRVADRRSGLRWRCDRFTARLVDCQVCVSKAVRDFAIAWGLPAGQLEVIANGIDTDVVGQVTPVDRVACGIRPNAAVFLFVGRLEAQKGISDLLSAAALLHQRSQEDWQLVVMGSGPQESEVRAAVAAHPNHLIFVGRQPNPLAWMAAADALVLPSLWEGMPNVVLEAMACGLPVIGTAVEGTDELVVPGETGWLVTPTDPEALADAIAAALSNPAERKQRGHAGRQRVEQHYTLEATVAAYDALFERLLAAHLHQSGRYA